MTEQQKIFIGPIEVAGYYRNLSNGLKKLGVKVDFITYETHHFGYGGENYQPFLLKSLNYLSKIQGKRLIQRFRINFLVSILKKIIRITWVISTIYKYDIFIFSYGYSLLPNNSDLFLIRFFNKKIISNLAHGSEARPAYIDGFSQNKYGEFPTISNIKSINDTRKKLVQRHFKFATVVLGAPFSNIHFGVTHFINTFCIGIPFPPSQPLIPKVLNRNVCNERIRILHSPSHSFAKGSLKISQAINNLISKGHKIDFILIQNKSNKEVLSEIEKCDFVVDQIYSDTPMATFAMEAAWFAKPAIVGGYRLNDLKKYIPIDMVPPSKICHPDYIENAIEELINNVEQRISLGKKAQEFVQKKWNDIEIAKKYLRIINNDIPEEWWINPKDVQYLEGAGQSQERTKQNIQELVKNYGTDALQLSHRPDLESAFLKFAQIETLVD